FHIDRCLKSERSNVKPDLTGVSAIEATGSHQVTIRLSKPNSGLPAALTNRVGCVVSPASVKAAENGNVDRAPVGTGPFRFVEWRDNDMIRVERNPNYWRSSEPLLDAIDFRIINELNTAARTVTAGEADLTVGIGAQQVAVARRNDDLVAGARPNM